MPRGGKRPGAGRKKGTPNVFTADVKGMLLEALQALGGVQFFIEQGRSNPTALLTLLGKTIPTGVQVSGDPERPVVTRTEVVLVSSPSKNA